MPNQDRWTRRLANGPLLSDPFFRRLCFARAITSVGGGMGPIALIFGILSVADLTTAGIVLGAQTATLTIFSVLGGTAADRVPRALLAVSSDLGRFATQAALGFLFLLDDPTVWVVALLAAAHGAGSAFNGPARSGMVADLVEPRNLRAANATLTVSENACLIIGMGVGGLLVATIGAGPALLIDAATFLASGCLLLPLIRTFSRHTPQSGVLADIREGLRFVSRTSWFRVGVTTFAVIQVLFVGTVPVLGPAVIDGAGEGASSWAAVMICFVIGSSMGGLLAGKLRPNRPLRAIFLAHIFVTPVMALLALSAPAWSLGVAQGVAGAAIGFGEVLWTTSIQRSIPGNMLGRAFALDWLIANSLRPAGPALAGVLGGIFGPGPVLMVAATVLAIITLAAAIHPALAVLREPTAPDQSSVRSRV